MPRITRRLSSNTTYASATPSSPEVAKNFMNFRFNHLTQRPTLPNRLGCAYEGFRTTNSSGTVAGGHIGEAFGTDSMTRPRNDPGAVKV